MNIKCVPIKELYTNPNDGFRVLSCIPTGEKSNIKLNRFGNFTLSGNNLSNLQLNEEANIVIAEDTKSKYEASYVLLTYAGIGTNENGQIEIDEKFELEILSRLMSREQAVYVNRAYPRFVNMVVNGEEDKIDYHNIYNVGTKRLPEYIAKVKKDCKVALFYPTCFKNGITTTSAVRELQSRYNTLDELIKDLEEKPYHVYMDCLEYGFEQADRLVKQYHPDMIDSQHRCEYGCVEILKQNEYLGDTRLNANLMAKEAKKLMPEASHYMVQAVNESKVIYYDPETKYAALRVTYDAERTIADNVLDRLKPTSNFIPMEWQKYKEVDGFECTEEQSQILKMIANGQRVALLTGSAGSGKTSSVKALIRMLEGNGRTYLLLAPTGVAAKRLRESTGRAASTIHMLLTMGEIPKVDYILIDEFSMVSVHLLSTLLLAIGVEPNLVFVCDEAQLASISCGNIVQNLIDSGKAPRANLTKVFRYGIGGIATMATDARMGHIDKLNQSFDDFKFVRIQEDKAVDQVLREYDALLKQDYNKSDILILSPYNKGPEGTFKINRQIQAVYNPHEYSNISYKRQNLGEIQFKVGDRVLNTKNNYHMPYIVFDEEGYESEEERFCANGDIGVVRECRKSCTGLNELVVEFDNGLACVNGSNIQNLILGYAISVHKIQGSQAKAVIVLIDDCHKTLLSRNLLYVALSRAQEQMTLISDVDVINEGLEVQENMERDTWLEDMLNE